ncbi:hypothetical protein Tco_0563623 [Tanacetum coccineum]
MVKLDRCYLAQSISLLIVCSWNVTDLEFAKEGSAWGVPANHLQRKSKYVLFVLRKYESFRRRPTAKGVGLRVADSRTGNHPEDDFTPLETIRRLYSVFGRRSHLGFEGETSEPKGRLVREKSSTRFLLSIPFFGSSCVIFTITQTILDAPPGYIGLYTHCFSLANLCESLTE